MINTRDLFKSTLDQPTAGFSFAQGLARARGALDPEQQKRWTALWPRIDGMVRSRYGKEASTNPLFLQYFRDLLAVRLTAHPDRSDEDLLGEAMGNETVRPDSEKEIEENQVEAERSRKAETARNAFEGHPRRAQ